MENIQGNNIPNSSSNGKFIQKMTEGFKAKGTEGSFGQWCKSKGFKGGCDPRCIAAAKKQGGAMAKKAVAAQVMCKAKNKQQGGNKKYGNNFKKPNRFNRFNNNRFNNNR